MNRDALDSFLRLDDEVRTMEVELKALKAERDQAEGILRKEFEHDGISNVKSTDGTTVYLHRQLWARAKDGNKDAVIGALQDLGLDDFLTHTFNTNQISAYVREQDALGNKLPDELSGVLAITEDFDLRVRRS